MSRYPFQIVNVFGVEAFAGSSYLRSFSYGTLFNSWL